MVLNDRWSGVDSQASDVVILGHLVLLQHVQLGLGVRLAVKLVHLAAESRKEGNVLFKDALNTFYLRLYGVRHMVKDHSDSEKGNPQPPHIGYSFRIAARVLLYAPSHRQDGTYHSLCCTSRGALAGTRNSSMGSPHEGWIRRSIAP